MNCVGIGWDDKKDADLLGTSLHLKDMTHRRWLVLLIFVVVAAFGRARAEDWVGMERSGTIAYFFVSSPPKIERYDIPSRTWLAPLFLPASRVALACGTVDEDGIYVSYPSVGTFRYNHGLDTEVRLDFTGGTPQSMFTDGDVLIFNQSNGSQVRFTTLDKKTNKQIDTRSSFIAPLHGASISRRLNRIYGTTRNSSPADILTLEYRDDGKLVTMFDSPQHGEYPVGAQVWAFADEDRIVDSTGNVYNGHSILRALSFGREVRDLAFAGDDVPIILSGNTLCSFTNTLGFRDSVDLIGGAKNILISGDSVVVFRAGDGTGISTEIVPLAELNKPAPYEPAIGEGVPFLPTSTFIDNGGVVNLFSIDQQALFRWDPLTQQWLNGVWLKDGAAFVAYSKNNGHVYVAHTSGAVGKIDLEAGESAETPFAHLGAQPYGLAIAGDYVFLASGSAQYTFDGNGVMVSSKPEVVYSKTYEWNEVNQAMYQLTDNSSIDDVRFLPINANGTAYPSLAQGAIGDFRDSPLHETGKIRYPIRPSPDGSLVAFGPGYVHYGVTLERVPTPSFNAFVDASWGAGTLCSVRPLNGGTQFQRWELPGFTVNSTLQLPGAPWLVRRLQNDSWFVANIASDKVPSFYVLNDALEIVVPPTISPPTNVAGTIQGPTTISVSWRDVTGETSYRIERRMLPDGVWQQIGTTSASETQFTDSNVQLAVTYGYRVTACHGAVESAPSEPGEILFDVPTPPSVTVAMISPSLFRADWTPSVRVTGYRVYRRQVSAPNWTLLSSPVGGVLTFSSTVLQGANYEYKVLATNPAGESLDSNIYSSLASFPVPSAPVLGVPSAHAPTVVALSWGASARAASYRIERRNGTSGSWGFLATISSGAITVYKDATAAANTAYSYRIYAINVVGTSAASTIRQVTTPDWVIPTVPMNLSARLGAGRLVQLEWTDSFNEDRYRVERKTGDGAWSIVDNPLPEVTNYADSSVANSTSYSYRIVATNSKGNTRSEEVAIRTRTSLEEWRLKNYSTPANTGRGASLEANGTGVPNLFKFAFNMDMNDRSYPVPENGQKGLPRTWINPATGLLQVEFVRLKASVNPGISYIVEFSDDLVDWHMVGEQVGVGAFPSEYERVTWKDEQPLIGMPKVRFARVRVSE